MRLFPRLLDPDWAQWESQFPNGLGHCVFSSPRLQRLMAEDLGLPWKHKWVVARGPRGQAFTLPVFAKTGRWNRVEIIARPVPYGVVPLECEQINAAAIDRVLRAIQTPLTAGFTWWLPPWFPWKWDRPPGCRWLGDLNVTFTETYLITINGSVEEHLATRVSRSQRERIRSTYRRGLEVIENPPPAMVDEYYQLYLRMWDQEQWSGYKFSYPLICGLATRMDEGAKTYLMRYRGELVGGGIVLFDRCAVHYFHGAMDRKFKEVFPHYILCDLMFKEAQKHGLRYIDLGCAAPENEGLKFFKKSWGALPTPLPVLRWRYDGAPALRAITHIGAKLLFRSDGQPPSKPKGMSHGMENIPAT